MVEIGVFGANQAGVVNSALDVPLIIGVSVVVTGRCAVVIGFRTGEHSADVIRAGRVGHQLLGVGVGVGIGEPGSGGTDPGSGMGGLVARDLDLEVRLVGGAGNAVGVGDVINDVGHGDGDKDRDDDQHDHQLDEGQTTNSSCNTEYAYMGDLTLLKFGKDCFHS